MQRLGTVLGVGVALTALAVASQGAYAEGNSGSVNLAPMLGSASNSASSLVDSTEMLVGSDEDMALEGDFGTPAVVAAGVGGISFGFLAPLLATGLAAYGAETLGSGGGSASSRSSSSGNVGGGLGGLAPFGGNQFSPVDTPEPGSLALLSGVMTTGAVVFARRRNRK